MIFFANCEPFYVCIIFVDFTSWAGCLLKVSCYLIFKSQFVRGASIKWRILTTSTMCCWDELSLLPPSQSFLKLHLATLKSFIAWLCYNATWSQMHPSDWIPFPSVRLSKCFYKVNGMEEVHRRGQTRSKSSLSDDMPRDNGQGKVSVGKRLTTVSI